MRTFCLILGAGLVVASAASAAAQPSRAAATPDPWAPWLGCWQIVDESIEDAAALLDGLSGSGAAPATTRSGALVCVTPSDGGATMTTYVNDNAVLTETIVADGAQRPLADATCRGWQRAEWSAHGPRLYANAEVTCGDQATRQVSGMSSIVTGPRWVDIQMIESDGRTSMRVRRYRRAADQRHAGGVSSAARALGTMPLGARLTFAEIKEASAKVPTDVLQAAVLELSPGGYELNSQRLLDLDAAGVPDRVIDLMVAMSFPEKFVVERASSGGGGGGYGGGFGPMWGPMSAWPYYYADPFYYSSLYSPFGYNYWGYYDPYYYRGPGVIIIDPGNGGVSPTEPSGDGRVVDGRGYTRIRRNEPEPATRTGNGGTSGWGTSSAGNGTSSTGSGSSGVSSGGYSSGGSSGGSGRTAVPRPPGGE